MYQRILVPVDGSPTSTRGLDEAIKLAKLTGGQIRVFHAIDEYMYASTMDGYGGVAQLHPDLFANIRSAGEKILETARTRVAAAAITTDTAIASTIDGRVSGLIIAAATEWSADLIVLGTHGRRGVGRVLLGSDAEQVVRHASVPVLLVRADAEPAAT